MKFWLTHDESARLKHIVHVLFDNHLGYVLANLGLRRKLTVKKKMKEEGFNKNELTPQLVLKILEDLDGTFIKLGQLLALRPDLIPTDYCAELTKLQDKVKPFSGDKAVKIVEQELGAPIRKLFKSFNKEPIAAASLGQVHRAVLKNGTHVAVKVRRPDIEHTIKTDLKLLYRLAKIIKKKYGTHMLNPIEIVREFERYTENELNYLKEAHNIDVFYRHFETSNTIIIPKVFWSHTKNKVLTMEYIPGKRLTDLKKFKPAQKKKIINTILNSEFEQIFRHGVFHADPHPGNYIIKRNGRIALLDFGIVGRLDYILKENITDFFMSLVNGDVERLANDVLKLGVATDETDIDKVKRDLYEFLGPYYEVKLDTIKLADIFNDIMRIFRENKLKISPNFVLLVKATVTLESVAQLLNPNLNFITTAKPFVKKLVRERLHPSKIVERAKKKVETMFEFADSLPRKTNILMTDIHDTARDLNRLDGDISSLTIEIDRSSNRLTLGFLAGTLFIASTILVPFQPKTVLGMPVLSFVGYISAFVITISIFISIVREKKI